ncbi:hypothetical protein WJX84_003285 [Apatococcus fuscideae]|uniref:Protein kinase domain-containing protein n=1 Tax=Apatococcus fuscideae TaxID=2026836 RepID=A0AAW1SYL1_9CHLO
MDRADTFAEGELLPATPGHPGSAPVPSADIHTLHGDNAAQRRAIGELLFFASVGDLRRCERLVKLWGLKVSDPNCCDYDRRTPLHLAASEGSYRVAEWLLEQGANVNAMDRFKRTPTEEAVTGDFGELVRLLLDHGGKVWEKQLGQCVDFAQSHLSNAVHIPDNSADFDPDWEVDPKDLITLNKLGEGEFGVVHKAIWNGTLVAVKILKISSAIALADFRSELEVMRRVHHPNAVQFLGGCTKQEPYLLVTELMSGGSLADAFRSQRVFALRRALEIAVDCARGLAYLHNKKHPSGVVHRDLKPANLMVAGSSYHTRDALMFDIGTIKLSDFGLSKSLPVNKHAGYDINATFRLTGETGSYRYMAPEVFRHEPYNIKVDVYSFAMILYQLLEHCAPFQGMDPVEAAQKAALQNVRPKFKNLDSKTRPMPELKKLVIAAWDPNPERRPDMRAVVDILDDQIRLMPRGAGNNRISQSADGTTSSGEGGGGKCCTVQ